MDEKSSVEKERNKERMILVIAQLLLDEELITLEEKNEMSRILKKY